jgi:PAS domain S-box-containing protein
MADASGVDTSRAFRSPSLRWRLPALMCALFLVLLTTVLYTAYREVDAALLRAGGGRAQQASTQIAELLRRSGAQALEQLQRTAATPALRRYLRDPSATTLAEAQAALPPIAQGGAVRRITVWDATGRRMFDIPGATAEAAASETLPAATRPPGGGLSRLQAADGRLFSDAAVAIDDEPSPDGRVTRLGTLSERSRFRVSPPDALNRLVGRDARIGFGNRSGDVWTDLAGVVSPPAIALSNDGLKEYRASDGEQRVGALTGIPGMPWAVWVEFSRAALTAEAQVFLQRMTAFGLLVAAATGLSVWWITKRVTLPLTDMTRAAEAIAGGDYSRRVAAERTDEIGRLGRAFNAMTGRVADAQQDLQERVDERTRELHTALTALGQQNRDREAYLATLVDSSDDAIIGADLAGSITSWNKGAENIFGYSAGEMVGTGITRLIPADRHNEERELLDRIERGGSAQHFETLRRTKDGRSIDISVTVSPIRDATGRLVGMSKVARDITGRKQMEEARQMSEARYRALFEYAPDGIVIADHQSRYLDANPSVCRMLGYSLDEFIGLQASDIVVEAEVPHIAPALAAIAATADYHREWQFRRKDGSVFSADVIATTLPDGDLMAMIRDVTDRNQAIEALRTAEERMRFALQSANVGIWDMDYTTGVLQWSETFAAQHGLAPGSSGGTFEAFLERIHPDDRAAMRETMRMAMASGADFSEQHRTIWRDGTVRWLRDAGRVRLNAQGEPVRGVGISLDITQQRTLEEQYQQAQKMEAVGRLAGGVAHDFNNLLTVILGFCELSLAGLDPDDPRRGDIEEIQKAGTRAADLTRQLLAFSRKQIIELTLLDLTAVVVDMQPMLARLIGEDVRIVLGLSVEPALVTADRGQVEQIVMNLTVNARDAMPRGGVLTIETACVELDEHYASTHLSVKPGPYVVLTVTDTGTGMTPEVQARLFEPFFTTKGQGKGTGLGMATVYGIVARSGGSVGVYSEVGRGTSFRVYFPKADDTVLAEDGRPLILRPRTGSETVLVVEDEHGLRELTKKLLERQGYTVLTAANAREARRMLEEHASIDVLLTDVIMPGGSGPDLTAGLGARWPDLRVIYMSGYTEETIVHHGVLDPGIVFLHKPFTSDTLGQKLREVLDR